MFGTDAGHFSKYLTTLGVGVVAGTISLAGLFLRLKTDLLVTQAELIALSPDARATVVERQGYIQLATSCLGWFVVAGLLLGVVLFAYGLFQWSKKQKVLDEHDLQVLAKIKGEVTKMTEEEQRIKRRSEAETAAASASDDAQNLDRPIPQTSSAPNGTSAQPLDSSAWALEKPRDAADPKAHNPEEGDAKPAATTSDVLTHADGEVKIDETMRKITSLERSLAGLLASAYGVDHRVNVGVRIKSGSLTLNADYLLEPLEDGDQYVVELKYVARFQNLRSTLRRATQQLVDFVRASDRPLIPVLVVVIDDNVDRSALDRVLRRYWQMSTSESRSVLRLLVMFEYQFAELSPTELSAKLRRPTFDGLEWGKDWTTP